MSDSKVYDLSARLAERAQVARSQATDAAHREAVEIVSRLGVVQAARVAALVFTHAATAAVVETSKAEREDILGEYWRIVESALKTVDLLQAAITVFRERPEAWRAAMRDDARRGSKRVTKRRGEP